MPLARSRRSKAAWALILLVLLSAAVYEFWPDGSTEAGIPAGVARPVRRAMARLRSRRASRRCSAAFELGRAQAAAAVPFLVRLLADDEDAMGPLERFVQNFTLGPLSRPVWGCATTALQQIGSAATPALIEAFRNPDARVSKRATAVLAQIPDPEAVRFFSGHLEDPDPYARQQALISIFRNGSLLEIDALRRAFRDPDPGVRVLALGYAEPGLGVWVYDAIVRAAEDPDANVRSRAKDRLRFWPR